MAFILLHHPGQPSPLYGSSHSWRGLSPGSHGREGGADLLGCVCFPDQQWLLGGETWLAGLEQQQQQDCVAGEEPEASGLAGTWPQTHPETRLPQLVRGQKRRLPLQLQRRDALRAAEWNIRQKKLSFQLERIIRKQRLLEAQKRLEPLEASCWPQGDCAQKLPYQIPCSDALVPGPQCRSKSTSCSSLSLQRLCGQYLPQLRRYSQRLSPGSIG